jgi:hypothetical protein
MDNSIHPFWKWAWAALEGALKLAVILFPVAMLLVILVAVFIEPWIVQHY